MTSRAREIDDLARALEDDDGCRNAAAAAAGARGAEATVSSGGSVCAERMARGHFRHGRIRRGEDTPIFYHLSPRLNINPKIE